MKIFTIKKEFKKELIEEILLSEVKSKFKSFETNFHAIFKFEEISDLDQLMIYKLINNIKNK